MKKSGEYESAASSVIGTILLVGLTVIMVSMIAVSVFAFESLMHPPPVPQAKIVVMEARGDIDKQLYKNTIILKHKGGDMLVKNNTKIIIAGEGYAYIGEETPGISVKDIQVTYRDLSGNNYGGPSGQNLGEIVEGTTWDTGAIIKLYGSDGKNINSAITNKQNNTVNSKWKLKTGSVASIIVIDIPTNQIIATLRTTVKRV